MWPAEMPGRAGSGWVGPGRVATETGNAQPTPFPTRRGKKYAVRADPSLRLDSLLELPTKILRNPPEGNPHPPKPTAPNRPFSVGEGGWPFWPVGPGRAGSGRAGSGWDASTF